MKPPLDVGGLTPLTSIDFPGKLAAVIFCRGCTWRCRYCHNTHLQPFISAQDDISWNSILEFLEQRRGFLDGAVFSGGEPLQQRNLPLAMKQVRDMGFEIGLHTSGSEPERFREVLPLTNWIGMDVKAPFDERYDAITGIRGSGFKALESLRYLLDSGVDYQLRTTVHPLLLTSKSLEDLQLTLADMGARPSVIQTFRSQGCQDEVLCA